ncbi:hypothetical protein CANMA_004575 [Candida margitis]|uniref:uncharacterized protein n=1 Tax=Candida margitis TaxID=1775924 RepID=UPI002226D0D3|nr:uncharacterized protein CANMA_004575 [Candida margitis]KAI5956146.1 hypothetical protein CANMA_004575 [Candida margitis]
MGMPMVSNRVALSTIGDGQLNSNQSLSCSTPLANKQRTKLRQNTDEFKSMLSLTPSKHKRRLPDMVTKSFSIEKSGTYYNSKRSPAIKSTSFAEFNTDTSPTLHLKSSASAFKNDKAGLAATKLKLRLQFALYKVQQNKSNSADTTTIQRGSSAKVDELNFLNPILSPSASKKGTPTASPNYDAYAKAMSSLLTPPEPKTYYTKSINVNLQTKTKASSSTTTSLSTVAQNKAKKRDQKLKLFQIKKSSIHYAGNQKKLPLIRQKQDVKTKSTPSFNLFCPSISIYGSMNSSFNTPPSTSLPAITLNHKSETQLPPINKILKTPIKRANLSRSLRFQQSFNNAAPDVVAASRMPTTVDDTIDEDNDMTMLQNTTMHNSTIDQHESNSTMITKDIDETKIEDEEEEEEGEEKKAVLTSSPFHNNLGTPNSFSVAKSLLQLGGHRM